MPADTEAQKSDSDVAPADERGRAAARGARLVLAGAVTLLLIGVVRLAWVSDDGFITARSIYNLLAGHGLAVNPGHRVQAYTSPLFMLLCLPLQALTGSPYHGLMSAGLLASVAFALVVARGFRDRPWAGAGVLLAAAASTSLLTFSTAGLENALSHLLLALFALRLLDEAPTDEPRPATGLLAGLVVLTRFDLAVLVLPALLVAFARRRTFTRAGLRPVLFFVAPIAAWLAFATFYYGFPLPNTAYAKLNTAIGLRERVGQGLVYLLDGLERDPALALFMVLPVGLILARIFTAPRAVKLLLAGVWLYVGYVISIGGDFMGGRFLTAPLVVSLLVLGHELARQAPAAAPWAVAVAFLIGLPGHFYRADRSSGCTTSGTGIVDERACYVEHTGLMANLRSEKWRTHGYLADYRKAVEGAQGGVMEFGLVGMATFGDPRPIRVVERYALSEPLLARIRYQPTPGWRPGHLTRDLPAGYLETLRTGTNLIQDPCLRALHDRLTLITTGPLFSAARFGAIARMAFRRGTCPAP